MHKTAVNQERIKYMCPFDESDKVFDSITQLEQYVSKNHPGCTLATTLTENLTQDSSSKPKPPSKPKSKSSPTAPSTESPAELKRTTRYQKDTKASSKQILCKCPYCDKILHPTGVVGHVGRVHSGQLDGSIAKLEWEKVSFACPFCPEDMFASSRTFRTIEQTEAHVSSRHPNCFLTFPSNLNSIPKTSSLVFQPDGTMRKSQRQPQRPSMLDEYIDDEHVGMKSYLGHIPVVKGGDVSRMDESPILFKCPAPGCEKTNLTRHGLHAHYGMMHGGSVDFTKVKIIRPTASNPKKNILAAKTGPWSYEEHEAFIEGYMKYGNKWKIISTDYVPTRDAKQVGSHALNYLTARGEWHGGAARGNTGKTSCAGDTHPRASTRMIEDGDENGEELDADVGRESDDEEEANSASSEPDDGNSSHCICCFEGGNIVCCSKCPRAFHPKCLAKDRLKGGGMNVEELPHDWQCHRCNKDTEVMPGEEIPQYAYGHKKIRAAYAAFKDCINYNHCCTLLSNVLDVLKKLMSYDYGYVFAEPVNIEGVHDYLDIVETPMDYGTVIDRLESGNYADLITSDDVTRDNENSTMEEVLLQVLCDIERVTHNCQLYNKKGSSIYRIGDVHANKWRAYFNEYISKKLPENVDRDLILFRHNCRLELDDEGHSKRQIKKEKEGRIGKLSAPSPARRQKRKASEELEDDVEEDQDEDEGGEDDDHEDDEEEEECSKKLKQEESHAGQSSALIFTEDQVCALENVFFRSPAYWRNELESYSSSLVDSSPRTIEDESRSSSNASLGTPPGDHDGMVLTVNSKDLKPDKFTFVELAAASPPNPKGPGDDISDMDKVSSDAIKNQSEITPSNKKINTQNSYGSAGRQGTVYQQQWFERLDELKRFKVAHGTALGSATSTDKLYHWRLRQRKRYHLTLHRLPHLKKVIVRAQDEDGDRNQKDKQWLLTIPEMKGVFSLSAYYETSDENNALKPFTMEAKDVQSDQMTVDFICKKHRKQLYCPLHPMNTPSGTQDFVPHSSRNLNSLFWDECLEELRFFQGENHHTFVPRDFPHSFYLSLWVEIQRAKYLLQSMGLFCGLQGAQMLVLDELSLCDLSSLPTVGTLLKADGRAIIDRAIVISSPRNDNAGKENGNGKTNKEKNIWYTNFNSFKTWYQSMPSEDKSKACELLPRLNWPLYSWCWRQFNAASAILCGTPSVLGVKMSVNKLGTLSSSGFFHAFPYNERKSALVCEDEYEGCEAFDSTLELLEEISIKYGSSHIPDWYECDKALRMWVMALETSVASLVKGGQCVLSVQQIEKLILIGFCRDRDGLPNLSMGDVVWLKMLQEFKTHIELFGVCYVSSDFPRLHAWIVEQKQLFLQSRMMVGKDPTNALKASRLFQLKEAGVDFFTGECLPGEYDSQEFDRLTSSPVDTFPVQERRTNLNTCSFDNYWNGQQCLDKFEKFRSGSGHSLLLASDDEDLYMWLMEKRGKALLSEIDCLSQGKGSTGLYSHSVLQYITTTVNDDGSKADKLEFDRSIFLWLHYYERLLIFKAREGHCKIPNDYPDMPLRRWLSQQQDLLHLYSVNRSIDLSHAQVKLLHAIGVHGSKRQEKYPTLNSRVMKRKFPLRKKAKHFLEKSKFE